MALGEVVNTALTNELTSVLNKHFDFSSNKISWEDLRDDWDFAIFKNTSTNEEDGALLTFMFKEIEDVVIHMPGNSANTIDWDQWVNDDDFLRYLIVKESLQYSPKPLVFKDIIAHYLKSSFFERPYRNDEAFTQRVRSFIDKHISNIDE